jgi:hypothetical protein
VSEGRASRATLEVWVRVPEDPEDLAWTRRLVNVIAVVAVLDVMLLAPLVWAAFTDREDLVSVLGPIHGAGFLVLLFLCIRGVVAERWGWWWPLLIVLTLGPIGSLIGDLVVRRELRATSP